MKALRTTGSLCVITALAVSTGCGGNKKPAADPSAESGDPSESDGASGSEDGGEASVGNQVGDKAPELKVKPVTGEGPTSIGDAAGKVVIVDFWATWCKPCAESFPVYQQIAEKYGDQVAVIAVSMDDSDTDDAKIKEFAESASVSFAVVRDDEEATAGLFQPEKMPTAFILDQKGVIKHVHAGYEGGEGKKIDAEVAKLVE